jgi:hypothetical protein
MTELRNRSKHVLRNMLYGMGSWNEGDPPVTRDQASQFTKEQVANFYMAGPKTVANIEEWLADEGKTFRE